MLLFSALDFSLPLKNPVIIFSLVLFIILFAPILFSKIKVPHIIGLILAGVIVGPHGLDLLRRDSSMVLFGTVGLLYIMFLAGLELDLAEFKKNRLKIFFFGITTFLLPFIFGLLASYYVLGFSLLSSALLASMFSTHTLVSYPIASKYGVAQNRAVILSIGGTMITDIIALLILAGISGMARENVSSSFWTQLTLSTIVFVLIVFFLFPIVTRWFFKRYDDSVSQYIFVLAMVFLAAFLAEVSGLEAIIGAFFSGLVLNKFVPHSSALMNRIDFVGNAIFIPFFLISVGMLVDLSVLINGWGALKVAGVIIVVAVITKYLAALITQKAFKLTKDEGNIIFGLSASHAAATLAIILVGYNIITGETANGEPIRLLNEDVLNGTILLILVSCAISSFVVEKASIGLALNEENQTTTEEQSQEKILISLAYSETVTELVDFGFRLKPSKSTIPVYALNVTHDGGTTEENSRMQGAKIIEKALKHASATENILIPVTRFDVNISHGIIYSIKEHNITDILIGLHHSSGQNTFFGLTAELLFKRILETIYIYKPFQPFNTIKRMLVLVSPKAEMEPGFMHWFIKLTNIAKTAGMPLSFFASHETLAELKTANQKTRNTEILFNEFNNWEDFSFLDRQVKLNDLFVIITSRKNHISYNDHLEKIPDYLSKYFLKNSFLIIYPKQLEQGLNMENSQKPKHSSLIGVITKKMGAIARATSLLRKFSKDRFN
ncbi:MAG: cation:proton antiporter [Flavobacterium sp.]|nr:cation:proton antiporter [Pedobacter sp.]